MASYSSLWVIYSLQFCLVHAGMVGNQDLKEQAGKVRFSQLLVVGDGNYRHPPNPYCQAPGFHQAVSNATNRTHPPPDLKQPVSPPSTKTPPPTTSTSIPDPLPTLNPGADPAAVTHYTTPQDPPRPLTNPPASLTTYTTNQPHATTQHQVPTLPPLSPPRHTNPPHSTKRTHHNQ